MKEQIEKQAIEEMACDMCTVILNCNEPYKPIPSCRAYQHAKRAYAKGYRKQSENVIEFPCKLGDKVYSITECSCEDIDGVHTECEFYGYGIDDRICNIPNGAKCPYQYRIIECNVMEMNMFMFKRYWGKKVFTTREEADKALAKMKGGAE